MPTYPAPVVQFVAGDGPWLWDRDGTRYLDAYNNVAVVGHAHPAVTEAVSRQLGEPVPIAQEHIDALHGRYQNVYGQC